MALSFILEALRGFDRDAPFYYGALFEPLTIFSLGEAYHGKKETDAQ